MAPVGTEPRGEEAVRSSLADSEDARLVTLAAQGDLRAFEALYARHSAPILRYCRQLLRSAEEAEDVHQEVFATAFSAMRRGAGPDALRPWLYRVAHNACMTVLRQRRPQPGVLEDHADALPELRSVSAQTRDDVRELLEDLRRLPAGQRAALLLHEMSGLSYEEVGRSLGMSVPTVRSLVFRARASLTGLADARGEDCGAIRDELLRLADRRGRRNRRITNHLQVCTSCSDYRERLRRRPAALRAIAPIVPAGWLTAGGAGASAATAGAGLAIVGGGAAGGLAGLAGGGAVAGSGVLAGGGATKVAAVLSTLALSAGTAGIVVESSAPEPALRAPADARAVTPPAPSVDHSPGSEPGSLAPAHDETRTAVPGPGAPSLPPQGGGAPSFEDDGAPPASRRPVEDRSGGDDRSGPGRGRGGDDTTGGGSDGTGRTTAPAGGGTATEEPAAADPRPSGGTGTSNPTPSPNTGTSSPKPTNVSDDSTSGTSSPKPDDSTSTSTSPSPDAVVPPA